MPRRDRQPCFVKTIRRAVVDFALHVFLVHLEKPLRGVAPCTEMILVENNEIPVNLVHPFVGRLYAARLAVVAKEVLE